MVAFTELILICTAAVALGYAFRGRAGRSGTGMPQTTSRRFRHRRSAVRFTFCLIMMLTAVMMISGTSTVHEVFAAARRQDETAAVPGQSDESNSGTKTALAARDDASADQTADTDSKPPIEPLPDEPGQSAEPSDNVPADSVPEETEEDPESAESEDRMLLLPLTADVLKELLGEDGAEALDELNGNLPENLRRAYALIPIRPNATATGTGTGVVGTLLTSENVETLSEAVNRILASREEVTASESPAESEPAALTPEPAVPAPLLQSEDGAESVLSAEMTAPGPVPGWMNSPGLGRHRVDSEFVQADVPVEDALRDSLSNALRDTLKDRARKSGVRFSDREWAAVKLCLDDDVVRHSIVETWQRSAVVATPEGGVPHRRIHALIEFPDEVLKKSDSAVLAWMQRQRLIGVGVAVGAFWLAAVVLALSSRLLRHRAKGFFGKLLAYPVVAGFVLLPLAIGAAFSAALAFNRTEQLEIPVVDPECRISLPAGLEESQKRQATPSRIQLTGAAEPSTREPARVPD